MNFLRLYDCLLATLYEDEDIVAIDKPYGFNSHTNDSKIEHSEAVQDGLIETYEKHRGKKLHIIHRLDQTTTGVMIFGKSGESAKKYVDFFKNRQVKKTYLFITRNRSSNSQFFIEDDILHKGKLLEAKTHLSLIQKSDLFELWMAKPLTGRNHQIRIHAKSAGISILGDPKYGGAPFSFLCLHNAQIEFPNGIIIKSKPPLYFENMNLLKDTTLVHALFEADRRQRLFSIPASTDQSFRLAHSSDSSNFSIDQFGDTIVLNRGKNTQPELEEKTFLNLAKILRKQILPQPKEKRELPPTTWTASEGQIKYELRASANQYVGLNLNQRVQRNWVHENSDKKSVLILFSGTGGFAVAAAMGGAAQLTCVDGNKNALNWGRRNFELNNLDTQAYQFLCRDSLTYLDQCHNKQIKFDIVVCDTPTFIKREKKDFKIKTDIQPLLEKCLQSLNKGGSLLFSTTFDGFYIPDIQENILLSQKKLKIPNLEINCILPSMDFELPDEKPSLKSFLLRLS